MKKFLLILFIWVCIVNHIKAQYMYGTTGLLQMPTAEMQKDKTFMFGVGALSSQIIPSKEWWGQLLYVELLCEYYYLSLAGSRIRLCVGQSKAGDLSLGTLIPFSLHRNFFLFFLYSYLGAKKNRSKGK